ncbi:hypothetical protein MKEN_00331200 [Mycena kentingensis (nom. inval.)]|nr:hypothetical protein MKEN_00331200 [Mycena kentingensis (nom. inval.)]
MSEPQQRRSSIKRRPRAIKGASASDPTTSHSFTIPTTHLPDAPMATFVETVQGTSKRVLREPASVAPSSPVKRMRMQRTSSTTSLPLPDLGPAPSDAYTDAYTISLWDEEEESSPPVNSQAPRPKKKKKTSNDPCMAEWVSDYRESYLSALLWLDGRGRSTNEVCSCDDATQPAVYRCSDCMHGPLLCKGCIVTSHELRPFHSIELRQRNGRDHTSNVARSSRWEYASSLDIRRVRVVSFVAPDIKNSSSFTGTGFTTSQSISADAISTSASTTQHNCYALGCTPPPVLGPGLAQHLRVWTSSTRFRYTGKHQPTTTITRWNTEQTLPGPSHWTGIRRSFVCRGNTDTCCSSSVGVAATHPPQSPRRVRASWPSVAPACPRPDVNLPPDWKDAAPADQCLYVLFIALDACFRLKRRLVGSDLRDPGLGTGWAYFVEWEPYRQYLLTVTDQKEISTCTGLAALDHANTKFARGYSATGVGAGICARHEFVLPNGVGDLQRGERYANMDYILASLLRHIHQSLRKIFSYDIACQWGKYLKERLLALPALVRLKLALELCQFAVPKMHINAHIALCRLLFSLALILGSGMTDGEGIEHQLGDHWSFWNWSKLVGLAKLLRRRLANAKIEARRQEDSFRVFSTQQAEHVGAWLDMVRVFEADNTQPNPYASSSPDALTEAELRKTLEEEDQSARNAGSIVLHSVGPSEFIIFGLELEGQQRNLRVQAQMKRHGTTTEPIRLRPLRKKLGKNIKRLRDLQATYTPTALTHLASLDLPEDVLVEDIPLLLPSGIPASLRNGCKDGLLEIECRLRHAQCQSALAQLRHQLHMKARLLIYKKLQSRHQGMNTRSRALVARNEQKIKGHSDMYQAARGGAVPNRIPTIYQNGKLGIVANSRRD